MEQRIKDSAARIAELESLKPNGDHDSIRPNPKRSKLKSSPQKRKSSLTVKNVKNDPFDTDRRKILSTDIKEIAKEKKSILITSKYKSKHYTK